MEAALGAAHKLGEKIEIVHASSEVEIDAAFEALRGMRASALLVQPDTFLINKRIVALAARDALPAMYQVRELVAAGVLISYGPSVADMYRQMGVYAGKVLKGANPAEMPVLQPTKFEMAINLKTAKALGLKPSDKFAVVGRRGDRIGALFCCNALCLLLAQSGHFATEFQCPLLGVKRTSTGASPMSAFDPKWTLSNSFAGAPIEHDQVSVSNGECLQD